MGRYSKSQVLAVSRYDGLALTLPLSHGEREPPSTALESVRVWRPRDIALRRPRRVQRRNLFECQCRSDIRSDRYYAAGDGAARHPYRRAKCTRR